jgi:hypothetical protein
MTEQKVAEIFEQVGLAKIVRELGNNELLNAVQFAMIGIAGHSEIPNNHEGLDEAAVSAYPLDGTEFDKDFVSRMKMKRQAFKAGAEWAFGQGETYLQDVTMDLNGERLLEPTVLTGDYDDGEVVIVQIRKK